MDAQPRLDDRHDDHPHGLAADLNTLARRGLLRWLTAGAALASPLGLIACGGGADTEAGSDGSSADSGSGDSGSCSVIPSETAGPYPGDGTNSNTDGVVNVLAMSGIVRSDITPSFGDYGGNVAEGVPLAVTLKLVNSASSCAELAGYAVYLWHCDRGGNYSLYSNDAVEENYLRGVQVSDSNGEVSFTTIFPACYSGRWPHIHFEVYAGLEAATRGNNALKTSQLALPAATCQQVYGVASGYDASVDNFAQVSLSTDNIFSDDNAALQLASVEGSVSDGFTATLTVGVNA